MLLHIMAHHCAGSARVSGSLRDHRANWRVSWASYYAEYIGTSPFDWVGDETSLPMGMAMYDLMGKIAEVPVWKLFGPMARRWVPVSAWFTATEPHRMAEAVATYAAQGHTWMKYHVSPFHNVLEQTAAMQSVAPEGFKIHYDFTCVYTHEHSQLNCSSPCRAAGLAGYGKVVQMSDTDADCLAVCTAIVVATRCCSCCSTCASMMWQAVSRTPCGKMTFKGTKSCVKRYHVRPVCIISHSGQQLRLRKHGLRISICSDTK